MKIWKITRWTAFHIGFGWLLWHAVNGHVAAGRVVGFWIWFGTTIIVCASFIDVTRNQMRAKGRSVPAWLSHSAGAAIVGWLVWHGWTTLAIVALVAEICENYIFSKEEEKK